MTKKKIDFRVGSRDIELFTALDRCPMTANQLCRLSETFAAPFPDEGNLRRRLRKFANADIVKKFAYAIANDGRTPSYYKLTRNGYKLLYGKNILMPKRRYFESINPGHHHHTNSLAELIVHLAIQTHQNDSKLLHFARENSIKLVAEPFTLYPDCAFAIERRDGRKFWFVVEFDNGTERVRSKNDVESIERKIRGYEAHLSQFHKFDPDRYLVLFVTTRSKARLRNIFDLASQVLFQPQRRLFVGCLLREFLESDPFHLPVFEDHRGLRRTIIPPLTLDKSPEKSPAFSDTQLRPVLL